MAPKRKRALPAASLAESAKKVKKGSVKKATVTSEIDISGTNDTDAPFSISGAIGYATYANGTYVALPGEKAFGKQVYRQVENPNWFVEYCSPSKLKYDKKKFKDIDREDDLPRVLEYMKSSCAYSGWVAKCSQMRGKRGGVLRTCSSTDTISSHPASAGGVNRGNVEVFVIEDFDATIPDELFEWDKPGTWGRTDYTPPMFERSSSVKMTYVTAKEVQAACERHRQMLVDIAVKGRAPKAVRMEDRADNGGLFIPMEGAKAKTDDGRACYCTYSTDRDRCYTLKYEGDGMAGRWYAEWQAEGFARSTLCCPTALPEEVTEWDYDDGHYKHWGLNGDVTISVCEDQEEIDAMKALIQNYLKSEKN